MKCPQCGNLIKSEISNFVICGTCSYHFDKKDIIETVKYVCKCGCSDWECYGLEIVCKKCNTVYFPGRSLRPFPIPEIFNKNRYLYEK